MKIDKSAREKVVRGRTSLLVNNGFFGFLAMQLRLEEADPKTTGITTMAVDGVTIFYSAEFVHGLTERELEGVLAHEIMHCCFQHMTRRQDRNPIGWNIAGDYVINNDLVEAGFTLPKGGLIDPKYKGMSTEDVYELLPKITIHIGSGGSDPGGMGGVLDAPGGVAGAEENQRTWEIQVRSAIAVARANNAGKLPGSLERLINQLNKPKISWRDKTRNFIDQSLIKDISWSRLSRRSVSIGALLPGLISDRLNHLVVITDVSGSVDHELLREFVSETAGALDEGTADQMTVCYADTEVRHVDHYVPGDVVEAKTVGGGGTSFSLPFKWVKENVPDASCIIYLTDLQVYDFGEEPECPVLWAIYAPDSYYQQLADAAPFGTPIQVSNKLG